MSTRSGLRGSMAWGIALLLWSLWGDGATAIAQARQLAVPAQTAGVLDQTVSIPVTLDNGGGVHSVAIELSWSPQVLKYVGVSRGELLPGAWTLDAELQVPGGDRLRIAGLDLSGGTPLLQGPGSVVLVSFEVIGDLGATTPINFLDCGRTLSDAAGLSLPTTCAGGQFQVANVPRRVLTVASISPACPEEFVRVPVTIDNAGSVTKIDIRLTFDSARLRLDSVDTSTTTQDMAIDWREEPTGTALIHLSGAKALPEGSAILFDLLFFVRPRAPSDRGVVLEPRIEFAQCRDVLNDGAIPTSCTPGALLVPGYCFGIGLNLLGPAIDLPPGDDEYTAKDLCADMDLDGTGRVLSVARQEGAGFVEYACGTATGDFPILVGPAFFVRLSAPATWTPAGTEVPSFGTFLRADVPANLVSLPDWAPRFTAEEICQQIVVEDLSDPNNPKTRSVAVEVSAWTPVDWEIHPCGTAVNDFTIAPGDGFAVKVSEDATWTFSKPGAAERAAPARVRSGTYPLGEMEVLRLADGVPEAAPPLAVVPLGKSVQDCAATKCGTTDRGAVFYWETIDPLTGYVLFGSNKNRVDKRRCDEQEDQSSQDCLYQGTSHFVTVPIDEGTKVYVQVVSGGKKLGGLCELERSGTGGPLDFPGSLLGTVKSSQGATIKNGVVKYTRPPSGPTSSAVERCNMVSSGLWAVNRGIPDPNAPPEEISANAGLQTGCGSGSSPNLTVDPANCDCPDVDGDLYHPTEAEGTACRRAAGYRGFGDCNDFSKDAGPNGVESLAGAPDSCTDGVDNDCDGAEDLQDSACACPDQDGDAFVVCNDPPACGVPSGKACGDCDDSDDARRPGLAEICDDKDNDCDGTVDEDVEGAPQWLRDADGDGYGDPNGVVQRCSRPVGYVASGLIDCDDSNPDRNPGETESQGIPGSCTDGIDNDCDGTTDADECACQGVPCSDRDADEYPNCTEPPGCAACGVPCDCQDDSSGVRPGAEERCNDVDDDCDGTTDEAAIDAPVWYRDGDNDSYGDPNVTATACDRPVGYVAPGAADCDDARDTVNPGVVEARREGNCVNGRDDDCDQMVDTDPECLKERCKDADLDGRYACDESCDGEGLACGDCDDADRLIPGDESLDTATRCADGKDNDCDTAVDLLDTGCWLTTPLGACSNGGALVTGYSDELFLRLAFSTDPAVAQTRNGSVEVVAKKVKISKKLAPKKDDWQRLFALAPATEDRRVYFSVEVGSKKSGPWMAAGGGAVVLGASNPPTGLEDTGGSSFRWNGPSCRNGAKYRIEFSGRAEFVPQFTVDAKSSPFTPSKKVLASINALRSPGGAIYWRVVDTDGAGREVTSEIASF